MTKHFYVWTGGMTSEGKEGYGGCMVWSYLITGGLDGWLEHRTNTLQAHNQESFWHGVVVFFLFFCRHRYKATFFSFNTEYVIWGINIWFPRRS